MHTLDKLTPSDGHSLRRVPLAEYYMTAIETWANALSRGLGSMMGRPLGRPPHRLLD